MPEPTDPITSERRVAEQADTIVAADVARTAATGRLKKRVQPRRLHPLLPPGSAGVGCLLVILLLLGSGLAVAFGGPPGPPTVQPTPTPIATPTSVGTPTASPGATSTPIATASATPAPTSEERAHALEPPDLVSTTLDEGDAGSYVYDVTSRRSFTELDAFYAQELPAQGYGIGDALRFEEHAIVPFRLADGSVVGQVTIERLPDVTTRVQIVLLVAPPPGAGGPVLSAPDPTGDVVTDTGQAVSDPEVDIVTVSAQKVGERYRVTVQLAGGFTRKFSFAGLLGIGRQAETAPFVTPDAFFIWQTHGDPPELLIGRIDPRTGQVLAGLADGVVIVFDQESGTLVFEFAADQLPSGADRLVVRFFHKPTAELERNRDEADPLVFGGIICGGTCQP